MINKKNLFLLEEIVKKNFASKYKESVLGIFWSIIKPLLIMIIMTIIFSTLFHNKIDNYPVYLLSGKCIFDFFTAGTNIAMMSLKGNKNILTKTPAPKHIFVLGGIISELINFFITLIILIGVMIVTQSTFHLTIILTIFPIISLVMIITGIGFILSILNIYYTDIHHLWGVVTLMGVYSSAIFYPMEIIPEPFHKYMVLNPIFWIIDQFRALGIYGVIPDIHYILNSMILSLIILVLGIIIFKTFEKRTTLNF